jgi:predicted nucleic acid-binding protein
LSAFLDSNVLLYAVSSDATKASVAGPLVENGATVSVQVLNEFANIAFKKHRRPWREIGHALRVLRAQLDVQALTIETHELGLQIAERYRFSFYDSLLVAAALQARCTTFYSEDLHHGQVIGRQLTIRNPFV